MPRFTFDNHSRSVEKAQEAVSNILGSKLKAVEAGTNITRCVVETVGNITGDQQNAIAKALANLPKVAEAANTPAKKAEEPAVVPVVETPVVETPVVETPVVETPEPTTPSVVVDEPPAHTPVVKVPSK